MEDSFDDENDVTDISNNEGNVEADLKGAWWYGRWERSGEEDFEDGEGESDGEGILNLSYN